MTQFLPVGNRWEEVVSITGNQEERQGMTLWRMVITSLWTCCV